MINDSHLVNKGQFYDVINPKTQILLANTLGCLDEYFTCIKTRHGGSYNEIFTYTISIDGVIYQHFNPKCSSKIFDQGFDSQIISIGLENVGWLKQNEQNKFIDWKGYIYNGEVFEKCWRGKHLWASYTLNQVAALLEFLPTLIKEHNIEPKFSGKNLTMDKPQEFKGVLNRSNYYKFYYDLSPAFDGELITNKLKTI